MFVIQSSTGKFLKQDSYQTVVVSATPVIFKTKDEANKVAKSIETEVKKAVKWYTDAVATETANKNKATVKLAKLKAKKEAWETMPYRDAVKKIAKIDKAIESEKWYTQCNSIKSYTASLRRVEKILKDGITVVECTTK